MQKDIRATSIQPWALLPLRLFLGLTFVYAGIQKITDPQFFQVSAQGFIGRQIARFAVGSPIHDLLVNVAQPHAKFFGLIIIFGEIAIGLGTLFGFLFRPAAFFGALLSLLFFLSASFHVYPYFYGADIVFTFAWLTLMLYGPLHTGLPTLDEILTLRLVQNAPLQYQQRIALFASILLGIGRPRNQEALAVAPNQTTQQLPRKQQSRQNILAQKRQTRRTFIWGSLVGGATALGIVALGYAWRIVRGSDEASTTGNTTAGGASNSATATTTVGTPAAGSATIAKVSAVPKNSAMQFTIPSTGDPGILVHLNNDQFVAFDALCTHAGCTVAYDSGSQLLQCPCHGAAFDPTKNAEVVSPPAPSALAGLKIQVDSAGNISLG